MKTQHVAKWLKGNGGTEFLQFQSGRITRLPFPMGGYIYTTSDNSNPLYRGNSYAEAVAALPQSKIAA